MYSTVARECVRLWRVRAWRVFRVCAMDSGAPRRVSLGGVGGNRLLLLPPEPA